MLPDITFIQWINLFLTRPKRHWALYLKGTEINTTQLSTGRQVSNQRSRLYDIIRGINARIEALLRCKTQTKHSGGLTRVEYEKSFLGR